jgi:hypothetical protein
MLKNLLFLASAALVYANAPPMIIQRPNCTVEPCAWVKASSSQSEVAEGLVYLKRETAVMGWHSSYLTLPTPWGIRKVMSDNSCYNFGAGVITNTYAQPGRGTGNMYKNLDTCAGIVAGAISDGLVPVKKVELGNYNGTLKSCHYMALVLAPGKDFHWLRLMKPEFDPVAQSEWWHKPGGLPILTKDFSGAAIPQKKLEQADLHPYTQTCRYFRHCVQIQ